VGLEVVWVVSLKLVAASVEESVLLLLPILEKEENENGGVDWLLPPWRKRRSFQWRGISVVKRVKGELVEAWLGVAESTVERECRERDLLQKKTGEEAGFFRFLDPSLSSLRP